MTKLLKTAKAVVENWYQNKAVVDSIEALRQAAQDAEVYTPFTNAEHYQIWSADGKFLPISDWNLNDVWEDERAVERAVIERLGLRWPE